MTRFLHTIAARAAASDRNHIVVVLLLPALLLTRSTAAAAATFTMLGGLVPRESELMAVTQRHEGRWRTCTENRKTVSACFVHAQKIAVMAPTDVEKQGQL